MRSAELDRRSFLARLGLLGAVAGSGLIVPGIAIADPNTIAPAVADLTLDTFNGLAAFVVPGNDDYSRAQGTPRNEPGAVAARTGEFLIEIFDHFLPLPPEMTRGIARALANGLADVPIDLPADHSDIPPETVRALDGAVREMLTGPGTVPLAQIIALLLNQVASVVNPGSTQGVFPSPFASLSFGEKAFVFSLLEDPDPALLAAIVAEVPEPLRPAVPGLLPFMVGGLLAFPAFGTYGEWSTFNPASRSVRQRPVGWDLSGFDPGILDGWHDFKGYYQGRREVRG